MNLARASRKIYVATSWRNEQQPIVVETLRRQGHQVYDFRNPRNYQAGFQWEHISSDWRRWSSLQYRTELLHPIAEDGFCNDWSAMQWADTCVLVLPSGRSAHLEAGWFVGAGKALYILIEDYDAPELMYKMATKICVCLDELIDALDIKVG